MLRDISNWREPAKRIEEIMTGLLSTEQVKPRDFSPSYYGAFIARFAIAEGDLSLALRILRLGLVFNHEDEQLLYLTRVVDRIVPPELLEKFRQEDARKHPGALE
jgi:hypothetical protein